MNYTKTELPKKMLEITVELTPDEFTPFAVEAAKYISESREIKGFRKGKAPYDMVIREMGEMTIFQNAANDAIAHYYYDIIEKENIETIDQPDIKVEKLAPGNPFIFKATVALMPKVTLCDFSKLKVEKLKEINISKEEVEKVLQDLAKMRKTEVLVDRAAATGDKVEMDFEVLVDKVLIEGGSAKKFPLTIGEGQMIPGFEDAIVGLKKDEDKEFTLSFPENYHAKHLAGKEATFKVKVTAVYELGIPEINDEFAKSVGLTDLNALKTNIENNLKHEQEHKAKDKQELEIFQKLIDNCQFDEIPDMLVSSEAHKMVHELEDNVTQQGGKFEDYLSHIKKTEAELILDFTPDAIKRVKTALATRAIATTEGFNATEEEIHAEMDKTIASYKLHPSYAGQIGDLEKNLHSEQGHRYIGTIIVNRKVLAYLKEKAINS